MRKDWPVKRHSQRKRGATDRPDLRSNGASPRPYRGDSDRCVSEVLNQFGRELSVAFHIREADVAALIEIGQMFVIDAE